MADLYESMVPELSEEMAHYGFAVWPPGGDFSSTRPLVMDEVYEVIWSRIVGAERQVEDSDAALDDEQALLSVLLTLAPAGRNPIPVSVPQRKGTSSDSTGLLIGRIRVRIIHQYPLS